jgi:hypothetical protein
MRFPSLWETQKYKVSVQWDIAGVHVADNLLQILKQKHCTKNVTTSMYGKGHPTQATKGLEGE